MALLETECSTVEVLVGAKIDGVDLQGDNNEEVRSLYRVLESIAWAHEDARKNSICLFKAPFTTMFIIFNERKNIWIKIII